MKAASPVYTSAGALFGDGRTHRYHLHRYWKDGRDRRILLWIMLNPSTADETKLDPTLRRCQGYALDWGFDGFEVCNIFALRSTDPKALYTHSDPAGPLNEQIITTTVETVRRDGGMVVAGWGTHGELMGMGDRYRQLLWPHANCLGTTKNGQPKHPLYLPSDAQPVVLSRFPIR